ncbi:hypothetical protein [Burkholderia sp. Ac-20353]|uniref:hypothetical protein n=1 Tax=Burkholderia sp. Ac-20353 TaxID=2703894 RepID=UPI00197CAA98|nr:hypothetical protein [Burkholderia sp. Ac-20353]MBN3789583.1 hypothetical protein [Burkholderia sp. Ac-20353]
MWQKGPTRNMRFLLAFQARVRAFSFLFKSMATHIGLQRAPRKLRYEGSGFHSIAMAEIVLAAARGVQVGFPTGAIGFAYRTQESSDSRRDFAPKYRTTRNNILSRSDPAALPDPRCNHGDNR